MNKFDAPRKYDHYSSRISPSYAQNSRISQSLQNRPLMHSPRGADLKDHRKFNFVTNNDNKMKMLKSRVQNYSMNSKIGFNQNNLFPEELLFLIANQEDNVIFLRNKIQGQKQKIEKQFQHFEKQIIHIIEDLKVSIDAQLDSVYRQFINMYKELKVQIADLREARRNLIQNYKDHEVPRGANYSRINDGIMNQTTKSVPANYQLLQQISKDAEYFRNHRLYEQVTNLHLQAMNTIIVIVNDLIAVGGYENTYYSEDRLGEVLQKLKNKFQSNIKNVFDNDLSSIVAKTKDIIEDNNMLLKGLNINDEHNLNDNDNKKSNYQRQDNKYPQYGTANFTQINQKSQNRLYSNKNRRSETQLHPYGFEISNYRGNQNAIRGGGNDFVGRGKQQRPTSKSDYQNIYHQRPNSSWDANSDFEADKQKYQVVTSMKKPQNIRVSASQQIIEVSYAEEIKLKNGSKIQKILANESENCLLCCIFINSGKHIAIGSKDFKIYIYEVNSGRIVTKLVGHDASVCSMANFGSFFVSGGDNGCNSFIIWDANTWKIKRKVTGLHSAAISCILDLGDGASFATGGYDKNIQIFNYKNGSSTFDLASNRSAVSALAWNRQNRKMISSGLDFTITIWSIFFTKGIVSDMSIQRIITDAGLVCSMQSLSLSYDNFIIGNKEGKIKIINVNSGQILKTFTVGSGSIVDLVAIQRQNKPFHPLIISSSKSKDLVITKADTGINSILQTNKKMNIEFGCGIGPKIIFNNNGLVGILSHSIHEKSVSLFEIEIQ